MTLPEHEAWELKPRKLTPEEIDHPEKVVEEFFQYAHLPEVRWIMWESFKSLVTGNYVRLKTKDRVSLVYFYEQLEKLLEGVHVMHARKTGTA